MSIGQLQNDRGARYTWSKGSFHVYSQSNEFYGCLVPKVGCSSWLKYLKHMLLPSHPSVSDRSDVYTRSSHPGNIVFRSQAPDGLIEGLRALTHQHYTKWIVVRHPWARIISGFRSKVEGECFLRRPCVRKYYLPHLPAVPNDAVVPITFHEFIVHLSEMPAYRYDPHFRPITLLCQLRRIAFTTIADLDSQEDMAALSVLLGFQETFPEVMKEEQERYTSSEYYQGRTHVVHNCTRETVQHAEQIYGEDAALLGFDFQDAYKNCMMYGRSHPPGVNEPTPPPGQTPSVVDGGMMEEDSIPREDLESEEEGGIVPQGVEPVAPEPEVPVELPKPHGNMSRRKFRSRQLLAKKMKRNRCQM